MKVKKRIGILMCVVLLAALANTAPAALMNFYSGAPAYWNNSAVWTEDLGGGSWGSQWVPTATDNAEIQSPGMQLMIAAPAVCEQFFGGSPDWSIGNPISVDVLNGGALEVKTQAWGEIALIGYNGQIVFTVNSGGSVHVEKNPVDGSGGETVMGGDNPSASALLQIQGGTFTSDNAFSVNQYDLAGSANVQVDAGLLDVGWLNIGTGLVDIGLDGKIQIRNNEWDQINTYVSGGKITALGGTGTVMWDYGVTTPGVTTITAVPEPVTIVMLGLGGLLIRKRRKA